MYHINRNGQIFGPYTADQLQQFLHQGLVSINDMACINGDQRWLPLHHLLNFAPAITPPPYGPSPFLVNPPVPAAAPRAFAPTPILTPGLILINAAVFILMVVQGVSAFDPTAANLVQWGADYGPLTTNGEWWRLLSSAFVHIGILHLAMNMYALYCVGRLVERLFGSFGFAVLYLLAGVGGSLLSLLTHPMTVSAGASGAIFGLYGGLLAFLLIQRSALPRETVKSLMTGTALFLVINLVYGASKEGIDMSAHIGGLIAGFFAGLLLSQSLQKATAGSRAVRGILALVLMGGGMVLCAWMVPAVHADTRNNSDSLVDRQTQQGSLSGTIRDGAGAAVASATVTVQGDNGFPRTAITSAEGGYKIDSLPIGVYRVSVSASGFKESITEQVRVGENQTTPLDRQLEGAGATAAAYTEEIRKVLQADTDVSRRMTALAERLKKTTDPDQMLRLNVQLDAAESEYVDAARKTDLSSCPNEFGQAYQAHLLAWEEMASARRPLTQAQYEVLHKNINTTWQRVEALAKQYGAQ